MHTSEGEAMTRKTLIIPALLAMLVAGAAEAYAQTATVVTHSGQRVRGQLVDMGSYGDVNYGDVTVRINGRDSQIPMGDVAMIDFVSDGRNIPQGEAARANQNNDGMVVLRNGRSIIGRVVDMEPQLNRAVVLGSFGRQNVALNQVARIYFGPDNMSAYDRNWNGPYDGRNGNNGDYGQYGNGQYGNNGQNGTFGQYGNNGQNGNYDPAGQPVYRNGPFGQPAGGNINRTVTVPSNRQWTDTGFDVRRGETIHFRASGNVSLSHNAGDTGTPAGATSGRLAGNSPLPGVTGGMLIGRVNNGQPFAIGADASVIMPANGRLELGINDDDVTDNTGNFVVQMSAP
jgi:hypothetical protein